MSKRKTRKPIKKKKPEKLQKDFECIECGASKAIDIKLDRKNRKATLKCRNCEATVTQSLKFDEAEIDVYCEWVDTNRGITPVKHMSIDDQNALAKSIIYKNVSNLIQNDVKNDETIVNNSSDIAVNYNRLSENRYEEIFHDLSSTDDIEKLMNET